MIRGFQPSKVESELQNGLNVGKRSVKSNVLTGWLEGMF